MTLRGVHQVAITVPDAKKAAAFYRDALGMQLLFEAPRMAFLACGATRVLLGEENASGQSVLLYFGVDDIRAEEAAMRARGVQFDEPARMVARLEDREVWLAVFRDPAGNVHHLVSEPILPRPA